MSLSFIWLFGRALNPMAIQSVVALVEDEMQTLRLSFFVSAVHCSVKFAPGPMTSRFASVNETGEAESAGIRMHSVIRMATGSEIGAEAMRENLFFK